MKKMKRFIPIVAAALLLCPMLNVQAAAWQKNQTAPKASLSALEGTVEMSLEQINSLEGTFQVIKKPEKGSAVIQSVNVVCSDQSAQGMTKGDKIFLASSGEPMNVTMGISMKFTVAGTYVLELDGGVTNAEGVYEDYSEKSENYICRVEIEAGNVSEENSSNQESTGGDFNFNTEFDFDINVETEELEEVLGEVADAIKSDEQLSMMQELLDKMNQGLALLEGGNQESVDEAAKELEESLEELDSVNKEENNAEHSELEIELAEPEIISEEVAEELSKESGNEIQKGFSLLKWIIPILAVFVFVVAALYFWRKTKSRKNNYDGAPMVDYRIEDDD
ncbi:MAG: hypothetical protein J6B94_07990 [Lachnospiraceae bacterium]|nr:hypothetical protein [Lachnospiraceae bacterium]